MEYWDLKSGPLAIWTRHEGNGIILSAGKRSEFRKAFSMIPILANIYYMPGSAKWFRGSKTELAMNPAIHHKLTVYEKHI